MKYNLEDMNAIFTSVKQTLLDYSDCSVDEFNNEFDRFKHLKGKHFSDNDYYVILVYVTFYSGFRASTVGKYSDTIKKYFGDYKTVMQYDEDMFTVIFDDTSMIQKEKKIRACISNAKRIHEIVKDYGSFENYINSFEPDKSDNNLFTFMKELKKFSFLGDITTYHFMMDIGLNALKPDRVIMRIFQRLGLVNNEKDYFEAVKVGRMFSKATGLPIRYIDVVFVLYGQLNHAVVNYICSEENPRCDICGASIFCSYTQGERLANGNAKRSQTPHCIFKK